MITQRDESAFFVGVGLMGTLAAAAHADWWWCVFAALITLWNLSTWNQSRLDDARAERVKRRMEGE